MVDEPELEIPEDEEELVEEEIDELVEQEFETIGDLVDEAVRLDMKAQEAISEGDWPHMVSYKMN